MSQITKKLFFLHGLHSSPGSQKCLALHDFVNQQNTDGADSIALEAPQLAYDPAKNFTKLQGMLKKALSEGQPEDVALIGSSMGGYYAACLSQQYGLRAALINPVVDPLGLLHRVEGQQVHPVTGEVYSFGTEDQQKFEQWGTLSQIKHDHILLCLGLKDETLNPASALSHYAACRRIEDPTGDHRFPRFVIALPEILSFLYPSVETD